MWFCHDTNLTTLSCLAVVFQTAELNSNDRLGQ
jgi:hypothetical protein